MTPPPGASCSLSRLVTLSLVLFLLAPAIARAQGTGRYGGTTQAGQAFSRGQAAATLGDEYLADGNSDAAEDAYLDAAEHYREALSYDAEYEVARERLAYVLYVIDRNEDALEVLEAGLELDPRSLPLRRMLGITLYEMGRLDEAVNLLETVVHEGGGQAEVLFILGKHYYESRAYADAIEYFQAYLVANPSDAATHGALGNAYLRTEQYELALVEFLSVLELDPGNLTAQTNMGDVHFASGDFARAVEIYDRVILRADDNYRVWFNKGKSHLELGQPEEALAAFERLAALRGDLYQAHYFRGVALVELDRRAEARDAFRASIERNPEHAMSQYRLGLAEARLGELSAARESLARARDLAPEEPWFPAALGDVYRRLGDLDQAIEAHLAALRLDDSQAPFHEGLARDYFAAGRLDEAVTFLNTALTQDSELRTAQIAMSVVLLHRGQVAMAAGDLEAAEADLTRAAALGRHPLELALTRAALSLARDDGAGASLALDAVADTARDHLAYRRARAYLAVRAGQPEEVSTLLADAAAAPADERDARDAALLGHAAAASGDWERALALFEQAAVIDPEQRTNVVLSYLELGLDNARRGRWQEAETQFDLANAERDRLEAEDVARLEYSRAVAALNLEHYNAAARRLGETLRRLGRLPLIDRVRLPDNDDLEIELRLAYAHYRNGDYEEALAVLEGLSGTRVDELLASTHERMSREAYERGEMRAARRHLEQALASAPRNAGARNNLACLMYGEGDVEEAGEIFGELVADDSVRAAVFNRAVYIDERGDDPEAAYRLYLRHSEAGGEGADEARELARTKEEVFGFDADG